MKDAGYIAVGAAITSYARAFTIKAAQANYDIFAYADTDSIHCQGDAKDVKAIKVHETAFLCWKLETFFDQAIFVRQKTYAEHVTHEDGIPVQQLKKPKEPYWNIKCAGLPDRCKQLYLWSMQGVDKIPKEKYNKLSEREQEFVSQKRTIDDFKPGLVIPGKLLPVHIPGGVVLQDVDYTLRV